MGQIIDRSLRLYRRNFLKFMGVGAIVQIPISLLTLLTTLATLAPNQASTSPDPAVVGIAMFVGLVVLIGALILGQMGAAALTQMAADIYLGQEIGILAAFTKIGRSWLVLLRALLLIGLLSVVAIIVFIIPCVGWLVAVPGVSIIGYLYAVVMPLLAPILVLERKRARPAIRRAWDLARRRFWWMAGFFFVLSLFSTLIVQGPLYLLIGITTVAAQGMVEPMLLNLLQTVIGGLLGVLYFPVHIACVLLLYMDTRIRFEGLDLALQAADGEASDPLLVLQQTPEPMVAHWLTGSELGQFILLSMGLVLVFGLIWGVLFLLIINTMPVLP
jgi:hypothetical protein